MSDGQTEIGREQEEANMRAYREGRSRPLQDRIDELTEAELAENRKRFLDESKSNVGVSTDESLIERYRNQKG